RDEQDLRQRSAGGVVGDAVFPRWADGGIYGGVTAGWGPAQRTSRRGRNGTGRLVVQGRGDRESHGLSRKRKENGLGPMEAGGLQLGKAPGSGGPHADLGKQHGCGSSAFGNRKFAPRAGVSARASQRARR